jgi:hypothetical protein
MQSYFNGISNMNTKHSKTLQGSFAKPTRMSIRFSDIELLLLALGAELVEREGSRQIYFRGH